MWQLSQPWWEFVVRGLVIYLFVFGLLRFVGKKQLGQLSLFDFVLLLIISNAVQNSMNAGDNSITAGLILALTLIVLNFGVTRLIYKSKAMENFFEGRPKVLIHNGVVFRDTIQNEQITHHQIEEALREAGIVDISSVHYAILESNGHISVMKKPISVTF